MKFCRRLSVTLSVSLLLSAQAAGVEITSLFPGIKYGDNIRNIDISLPKKYTDPAQPQSGGRFVYRYSDDPVSNIALRYKLYLEKGRLEKFTVQPLRDQDRDQQLTHWFNVLSRQYGKPIKIDDNGTGLGGRAQQLEYSFCVNDGYTEATLGRISDISYVTFEPIATKVRPACQVAQNLGNATTQAHENQARPGAMTASTLPTPSSLPSALGRSAEYQNLLRCIGVAEAFKGILLGLKQTAEAEKAESEFARLFGLWSDLGKRQGLDDLALARDYGLNRQASLRPFMMLELDGARGKYLDLDHQFCRSAGLLRM